MSSIIRLKLLGQSIWNDNIKRSLIKDGTLKGMIERREIYGVTSNPTIFKKAITNTTDYDADIQALTWAGFTPKDVFYHLAIQDIQDVADLFRPYYDASGGQDGFVSLEVNPDLAYDTQGTIAEAKWLWNEVNRPNLMVKIPATEAGLPAITAAIAAGVNVNVTLIFSIERYKGVMKAYLDGIQKRVDEGKVVTNIASVASFFVSRLETIADDHLRQVIENGGDKAEKAKQLVGKIAVDNTRLAYQAYEEVFSSDLYKQLEKSGAQKQRPLWASTSTKDPDYSNIKYVEELVAENTVNTVPPETLEIYLDHGDPSISIYDDLDRAEKDFEQLASVGISIDALTQTLEEEGVRKFSDSFHELISAIEKYQGNLLMGMDSIEDAIQSKAKAYQDEQVVPRMYRFDPTIWVEDPDGKDIVQKRLGWLNLPYESEAWISNLRNFADTCKADGIDQVLLLGMGGSSLAPETMQLIFADQVQGMSLRILDSTIPEQVREAEAWVDYKKTLFIVASKSGTTSETLSMFHYFWAKSEAILSDQRSKHFIAITDPGSSLMNLGEDLGFRVVFGANPNVGGRYSVLSHFGLVPAALIGIDLEKFLNRAQKMQEKCSEPNTISLNTGALLGIIMGLASAKNRDKLTLLADPSLEPISAWLEQLVAESSGKEDRGIVPVAEEPLVDVQIYQEDRLFAYLRESGALDSFISDLRKAGHPVIVLNLSDLYDLGAQFYLWQVAIAVACSILGVNAFDQPNVQDSKDRTKRKIAYYLEQGDLEEYQPIWEKDGRRVFGMNIEGIESCSSLSEVIDQFVSLSEEGDYIAINAYVPRNEENKKQLTELRRQILEKTHRATTLGFGPRFQHSTGQLHKGGANNGLFIQITQDDQFDIEIPGQGYTFGIMAKAQAQGDLDALLAKDRRAVQIHLKAGDSLDTLSK
jgi:transaldolase/glucose-6-phosphate isomerase